MYKNLATDVAFVRSFHTTKFHFYFFYFLVWSRCLIRKHLRLIWHALPIPAITTPLRQHLQPEALQQIRTHFYFCCNHIISHKKNTHKVRTNCYISSGREWEIVYLMLCTCVRLWYLKCTLCLVTLVNSIYRIVGTLWKMNTSYVNYIYD